MVRGVMRGDKYLFFGDFCSPNPLGEAFLGDFSGFLRWIGDFGAKPTTGDSLSKIRFSHARIEICDHPLDNNVLLPPKELRSSIATRTPKHIISAYSMGMKRFATKKRYQD